MRLLWEMSGQFYWNKFLLYYRLPKSFGKMLMAKYFDNCYLFSLISKAGSGGKGEMDGWVMLILQLEKKLQTQ